MYRVIYIGDGDIFFCIKSCFTIWSQIHFHCSLQYLLKINLSSSFHILSFNKFATAPFFKSYWMTFSYPVQWYQWLFSTSLDLSIMFSCMEGFLWYFISIGDCCCSSQYIRLEKAPIASISSLFKVSPLRSFFQFAHWSMLLQHLAEHSTDFSYLYSKINTLPKYCRSAAAIPQISFLPFIFTTSFKFCPYSCGLVNLLLSLSV